MYTNPVNDPFFKSTKHRADYSASFFTSDLNIGMLGCTEQYQFCNGEQKCSELHAWGPSSRKQVADSLGYNVAQRALFDLMSRAAYHTKIFNVGFMLEDAALLAKDLIYGEYGLSTGLPDDQWQREVRNLHNISIAAIQHSVVVHASTPNLDIGSGANSSHTYDWIVQESSSAQQKICQNQKISAPNFYSFNILSLSLLLVAGLVIIATSSMASSITKYWRRREQGKSQPRVSKSTSSTSADISFYCTKEWEYSDPLQLQRIALEGHGIAPWTETDSIPLPFDRQKLFRIPWLAGWPGKTFFIDRISLVV
jgi:hypothetical protein